MSETSNSATFFSVEERDLCDRFLAAGYVILPAEDPDSLASIRADIARYAAEALGQSAPSDPGVFLDTFHEQVTPENLNEVRLSVFHRFNEASDARPRYFSLARQSLGWIVGNELCMQRKINLSVQLPDDDSSLLPIHADVLNGDSPFEIVQWTPLVDCHGTKTMFILPPTENKQLIARLGEFAAQGNDALMEAAKPNLIWLEIPFGNTLVFNQNLLHGNIVNVEGTTRWSMNCRYKGVFTPYADKKIGEFFEPINLRPASVLGMEFQLPANTSVGEN